MLIVEVNEYLNKIRSVFPSFTRPTMLGSTLIGVLDYSFLSGPWSSHWSKYSNSRNLKYLPKSGMCEHFTQAACLESNWGVIHGNYGDTRSSMVEARVVIPKGYSLNGIVDGYHSTCLVGVTSSVGSLDYDLWFWEPQYTVCHAAYMTQASVAKSRGVEVIDIIL